MELFHEQRGVGGVMKLFGEELKKYIAQSTHLDLPLRSSITDVTSHLGSDYLIILVWYIADSYILPLVDHPILT